MKRASPPSSEPFGETGQAHTPGCADHLPAKAVPHRLDGLSVDTSDRVHEVLLKCERLRDDYHPLTLPRSGWARAREIPK